MSSPKNTIRINNKVYDISPRPAIDPHQTLRDLIREENTVVVAPPKAATNRPEQPVRKKAPRQIADIISAPRKIEKSKTLMRPAVKKPVIKPAVNKKSEEIPRVLPKNRERIARAKVVPKSGLVQRFNHAKHSGQPASIRPKAAALPVREPAPRLALPAVPKPGIDWPVIDQFEKAVQEASSHLETFVEENVRSRKSRKFAYALVSTVAVFAIGFGIYHELPMAQVKLAGNKAGFSPALPSYSPSGFGLAGPVKADYGQVTLSYKSRTDDKGFSIVQAPSEWSSQTLVDSFLGSSHKDYRTVKGNGQTIYTYDGSDATWVDSGIWYRVEGNAKLSDDQLLKIANGL